MPRFTQSKFLLAIFLCSLCGCQSPKNQAMISGYQESADSGNKSFDLVARNNSLSLLEELLNEEKGLSYILIIKSASPQLKQLVKNISKTASAGAKLIAAEKKQDAGLRLAGNGLPPGEKATREKISKIKEHDLLHSKNAEFELQLLLTQVEALSYGAQLALTAADNDPQTSRARKFASLSGQLSLLHEQVVAMLRSKGQSSSPGKP